MGGGDFATSGSHLAESQMHDDLENYHSVTPWSIIALLLGLISALALLSQILWIIPIGAVICAGVALWSIRAYAPRLTGRGMALAGLALGLIFGITAPMRIVTRHYWLETRAQQAVDEWLKFLSHGQPEKAFMATQTALFRQPLDNSLAEFIQKEPETQRQYNEYLSRPEIKTLIDARDSFQVVSRRSMVQDAEDRNDVVLCEYVVQFLRDEKPMEMTLYITVECVPDRATGEPFYRIRNGEYVAPRPVQ